MNILILLGISAAERVQIARYVAIAAYTLFLWDSLLLLEDERRLVHRSVWSFPKLAYLMCRYYPMMIWPLYIWGWVLDHEKGVCTKVIKSLYILIIPLQFFPQAVLVLRAWAFTKRNGYVLIILLVTLSCFIVMQLWAYTTELSLSTELYGWLGKAGCVRSHVNDGGVASVRMGWLMFASVVVDGSATLVVAVQYYSSTGTQSQLGRLFMRQGFFFFGVMIVLNIITGALWLHPNRLIDATASAWFILTLILPNMLACRLILQLRETVCPTETQVKEQISDLVRNGVGDLPHGGHSFSLHVC